MNRLNMCYGIIVIEWRIMNTTDVLVRYSVFLNALQKQTTICTYSYLFNYLLVKGKKLYFCFDFKK
jgi:hypothetical protein